MRIISSIILLFVITTVIGQGNHPEGLLKIEKVKTYWDKDSTIVRSLGFYNKSGYGSVGERTGLWRFWTKKGVVEKNKSIVIPMSNLPIGWYLLQIDYGSHTENLKLLKE